MRALLPCELRSRSWLPTGRSSRSTTICPPLPTPCWLFPHCPTKIFCCTSTWPCNGLEADFGWKSRLFFSEKPPGAQLHGGGTKAAPEHRGLIAARDYPRPRCGGSGTATHSATPLSGTSTLRHAITLKSGVFWSPERCCRNRCHVRVHPLQGGSALPCLWAKHPRTEPPA